MCGISVCVAQSQDADSEPIFTLRNELERVIATRGPDAQSTHRITLSGNNLGLSVDVFGAELRLRGRPDAKIVQPHVHDGYVFCWNGEVFDGMEVGSSENDGVKLFERLRATTSVDQVCEVFGGIEGPYAFVFYDPKSCCLIFARDPLGRRSLLVHKPTAAQPWFLLASCSLGNDARCEFAELETRSVYALDLGKLAQGHVVQDFDACLDAIERHSASGAPYAFSALPRISQTLPDPAEDLPIIVSLDGPNRFNAVAPGFLSALDRSVELRVRNIPPPLIAGTARLSVLFSGGIDSTILAFLAHKYIPTDEPIDLLNVAFDNPRKMRLETNSKGKNNAKAKASADSYMVPDRQTGLEELTELRRLCPRKWNFVEINIPYEESQEALAHIETLMYPSRTVMDLSLAMALFFASRGRGTTDKHPYTSPARVILNGLGADELLGGYSRHRNVFKASGWQGLVDELQMDIDRIPTRNLGRDDRVISSHGKEVRHPFLSLSFVAYLAAIPVHMKVDPRGEAESGVGAKALLRVATKSVGLAEASVRKKRAMQFGSRSARMDGEKDGDAVIHERTSENLATLPTFTVS